MRRRKNNNICYSHLVRGYSVLCFFVTSSTSLSSNSIFRPSFSSLSATLFSLVLKAISLLYVSSSTFVLSFFNFNLCSSMILLSSPKMTLTLPVTMISIFFSRLPSSFNGSVLVSSNSFLSAS